jgi:cyclopropane-fatty-acyl-phospholipid synthase
VDGWWTSPDPVALVRLFIANEATLDRPSLAGALQRLALRATHLARSNTRRQARRNIAAHYDLSNDLYALFLDPTMTYSSAVFEDPASPLEEAQLHKYRRIAAAAGVDTGSHVLEIGCGWGGFALVAAGELGCRVTGITLSGAQAELARERVARAGLDHRVDIQVVDYRDVVGQFDAVVSIEMLEAVGHRYLGRFFAQCDRLLRPGGRAAVQTITIPDQQYGRYRRSVDWIRASVFPGGHLPSLGAIQGAVARSSRLAVDQVVNIGLHYAETLRRWRLRFSARLPELAALGFDDRFARLWTFYLASCEAAFAERKIGVLQLTLCRPGEGGPDGARYLSSVPGADR